MSLVQYDSSSEEEMNQVHDIPETEFIAERKIVQKKPLIFQGFKFIKN
jgi:hypothetical protein